MRAPPTEPPITEAELLKEVVEFVEVVELVEVESVVEVVGMAVGQCTYARVYNSKSVQLT